MKIKFFTMATLALLFAACSHKKPETFRPEVEVSSDRMTPEILQSFGQVGNVSVSPDGEKVLYSVAYADLKANKTRSEWFVMNADGSENRAIRFKNESKSAVKWLENGEKIAFLSSESGSSQLWTMDLNGRHCHQISNHEGGISDFVLSPDGKRVLLIANVKFGERTKDIYPDLDKTTGEVYNDLMYKHWDEWVTEIPHPFLADFDGKTLKNEVDLLKNEPYECPMKPFGGVEQLAFTPDGQKIAYTCRKKTGKAYAVSTNSDIFLYDIASGETENLTEGMMGYDINPTFSPDGRFMAWESMERDGYESDKNRLFLLDLVSGEKRDLTANFDQSVGSLLWKNNSEGVFFVSSQHGTVQLYFTDIQANNIRKITEGVHDYAWVGETKSGLIGLRHSMSMPNEIYAINETSGEQTQLTFENKHLLDQLEMGRVEERWIATTDGKKMLTWVIYPPHFDKNKKYPAILYCQGGPQSPVSQFWSTRWNFQLMAANDYIIVAPNRHGLYGFGQEWLEQISGDYGGQNMQDYLTAIDELKKEPFIDENRLGCVGASYGGFSVYWLAGHHQKRFKAFIAHSGIFNLEQQYLETEEMWFANWDLGGAYWEKENAVAQRTYATSPHKFVDKWDTPILCIHGEKDYRILASQGMAAFNAAQLRGVPSQLLVFPDENHWILKPQNSLLWQRTFYNWLDKWLKVSEK